MGRKRRRTAPEEHAGDFEQPPEGCYHYQDIGELEYDLHPYFKRRHQLFSRYDEGIWMTEDAWFGVTAEPVANTIADHLAEGTPEGKVALIDAFAGVGGNTIAFALSGRWKRVYAIERDPHALECAKHNAKIYGVDHLISWYEGDCFEVLKQKLRELAEVSVIFGSPPWGGPGYRSDDIFDLSQMQPYNLSYIMGSFRPLTSSVALFLPRTSDLRQMAASADEKEMLTVVHYCIRGASKALCVYYGDLCSELYMSQEDGAIDVS